ncbi:MAG: RpoL/Rpb11 RNA polymerase subunit family protein [Candidatus Thorarchaeota archaeon]
MAKKKAVKPKEEEEELDDIEDELLDDEEIIGEYPKMSNKSRKSTASSPTDEDNLEELSEEDMEFEIEEEPRFPDYRHLNLSLKRASGDNDYELTIEGQSHGFCNILVKHLLGTEGVEAAAYKVTGIEPPKVFIRLKQNKNKTIKDILYDAIESLREEVLEVQKLFQKLI